MAATQIDLQQLVKLVQENPVIWDTTLDSHKDKSLSKQAWMSVCCGLNNKFNLLNDAEKQNFCKIVMKKWNYAKTMWNNGKKRSRKNISKLSRVKLRKFLLHDKLKFLDKNVPQNVKVLSNGGKTVVDANGGKNVPRTVRRKRIHRNVTRMRREKHQRCTKTERKDTFQAYSVARSRAREEALYEDRHISFCRGIIPSVQKFNEEQVLDFQMGVLRLIKDLNHRFNAQFRQLDYIPSNCSNLSKADSHHDSSTSTQDLPLIDSVVEIRDSSTDTNECFVKSIVHKATSTDAHSVARLTTEEVS